MRLRYFSGTFFIFVNFIKKKIYKRKDTKGINNEKADKPHFLAFSGREPEGVTL